MKLFSNVPLTFTEVVPLKKLPTYPFYRDGDSLMYVYKRGKLFFARAISQFFSVTQVTYDMEMGTYSDSLSICTGFGRSSVIVPRSVFSIRKFEGLNEYGLQYDPGAVLILLKYVNLSEQQTSLVTQYRSVGWVQQEKSEMHFCGLNDVNNFRYVGEKDLTSVGSFDDYVAGVNKLVVGHAGLEISLATSISAAVIGFLSTQQPIESLMVHFFGRSSCGKTTALQLAASVWGNPEMGKGILSSWNATDNALLAKLDNNYGVAACFDESSAMTRDFSKTIYGISQNVGKARLSKTSQLQKERSFCTSIISSGENSLLAASNKNAGLRARLLEFFDAPLTKDAEHSDAIKRFVASQHGTLGAKFVTLLESSDHGCIDDRIKLWKEKLEKKLTGKYALKDRLISKYSIILSSAELTRDKLGIQFKLEGMEDMLISHYNSLLEERDMGRNAYELIMSWLVKNYTHIILSDYLPTLASVDGIFLEEGDRVALLKSSFEKILRDGGFTDTKVVAHELKKLGLLVPESKDRLTKRVVINGIRVSCYCLKVNTGMPNIKSQSADCTPWEHTEGDDLDSIEI